MKFALRYLSVLAGIALISMCIYSCSPKTELSWYKGNLHTHSFWSDGDDFPENIMNWYQNQGYHFVALSDHNTLAEGEKWITIPRHKKFDNLFDEYLDTYGPEWVEYRDTGRLEVRLKTFDEYRPLFEKQDSFLILQGEEISDHFGDKSIHLNATNLQEVILPQGGEDVVDILQNNINAVLDQRERTGQPMIVHINHPNYLFSLTAEDLIQLEGERFFEVFNGHSIVYNFGDSIHMGTEEMWDVVNIAYAQQGKPLLYGIATDDSHHYHEIGMEWANAGRGWITVQSSELTAESLIEAMELGLFYASSGIELDAYSFENNRISIRVNPRKDINYRIVFVGHEKGAEGSRILKEVDGTEAVFELKEENVFVRAKIISNDPMDRPIEEAQYKMAWTQPVTYSSH